MWDLDYEYCNQKQKFGEQVWTKLRVWLVRDYLFTIMCTKSVMYCIKMKYTVCQRITFEFLKSNSTIIPLTFVILLKWNKLRLHYEHWVL